MRQHPRAQLLTALLAGSSGEAGPAAKPSMQRVAAANKLDAFRKDIEFDLGRME